ncbi:MAG: AAA family ATPase [Paludibacteraceae bacterium]|nr:AAA family ATPase [Paludibacteraceae bacterium]
MNQTNGAKSAYSSKNLTKVYYEIKEKCEGNFKLLDCYQNYINKQIENMEIVVDGKTLKPILYTLKVLILIGDATNEYSISDQELKLFVCTCNSWNDYVQSVESILRYRNDPDYKSQIDERYDIANDTRFNLVFKNLSYLNTEKNRISIPKNLVRTIKKKVFEFELGESLTVNVIGNLTHIPLQKIFYGAPGTGKSFSIKSVIAEHMSIDVDQVDMEADNIFRTTFHPDYDYAQFVGCYKPTKEKNGDITYDFVPQVFVNALVEAYGGVQPAKSSSNTSATTGQVANSGSKEDDLNDKDTVVEQTVESEIETQAVKPVYLVIEEINRGNCAQIFGDIFQLLDRNANGESEYSISVDKDLREYLEINCPNAICNGKIKIPANLSIIATMNTSDQSLFPMDSAFKRRWEWEYVPIKNQNFDKDGNLIHFRIVVEEGRYEYDWNVFQNAVNVEIKEKTNSEDKQMGDYFIKKDVTLDEFINKVMFYLWNDVCKENYQTEDNFFRTKENDSADEVEFSFGEMMADKVNKINGFMRKLNVKNLIETSESTDASDVSTPESSAD